MQNVTFPGMGLKFELSRTAFEIFGIPVYWYAILIVASILLGMFLCYKKSGKYGIHFSDILDLSLIMIPVAFIGARLYYILFNLSKYLANPLSIFQIRDGGLAIYGGIIGAVLVIFFFCKKRKIKILDLLDYLAPYLILGQAIGRWGNFINVEAYGTLTDLPWRMGIIKNGMYSEVHPTFLYESIGSFLIFFLLLWMEKKRKFSGEVTYIYLILYSFLRFFVEGLRIDSLMFLNMRISQILSLAIFVLFCCILAYYVVKEKKKKKQIEK